MNAELLASAWRFAARALSMESFCPAASEARRQLNGRMFVPTSRAPPATEDDAGRDDDEPKRADKRQRTMMVTALMLARRAVRRGRSRADGLKEVHVC